MRLRKIFACLLTAAMLVSLAVPAFALTNPILTTIYIEVDDTVVGFRLQDLANPTDAKLREAYKPWLTASDGIYVGLQGGIVIEYNKDILDTLVQQLANAEATDSKPNAVADAYMAASADAYKVLTVTKDGETATIDKPGDELVPVVTGSTAASELAKITVTAVEIENGKGKAEAIAAAVEAAKKLVEEGYVVTFTGEYTKPNLVGKFTVTKDTDTATSAADVTITVTEKPPQIVDNFKIYVNDTALEITVADALAELAGIDVEPLDYTDGEVIFEDEDHEYKLTVTAPTKTDRAAAGEFYVTISDKTDTVPGSVFYIAYETTAKDGPDGRTSKYLCAVEDATTKGYTDWHEIEGIDYEFGWLFGQDKSILAGYTIKAGTTGLSISPFALLEAMELTLAEKEGKHVFIDNNTEAEVAELTSTAPTKKDRAAAGEFYVTFEKQGSTTYYIAFEDVRIDGRVSKYLCAHATGYTDWKAIDGVEGFKFGFLFGQDKTLDGYTIKVGTQDTTITLEAAYEAVMQSGLIDEIVLKYDETDGIHVVNDDGAKVKFTSTPPANAAKRAVNGELLISFVKGNDTKYLSYEAVPKSGADGRTSKYLFAYIGAYGDWPQITGIIQGVDIMSVGFLFG